MAKGGGYEREFCKQLSLWWTDGADDGVFWRTSNSGGRATVRHGKSKKTKNQHGDVAATDVSAQPMIDAFCIELKRGYSRSTLFDLLDKGPKAKVQQVEAWIAKTIRSCEISGSVSWMLVTRRDQRQEFVIMPRWLWRRLVVDEIPKPVPFVTAEVQIRSSLTGGSEYIKLMGMLLSDWFTLVCPSYVKQLVDEERSK